jgi:GxxExxY protein
MVKLEYKYSDITEKIIGCAMKVHSWFGPGFPEIIYQRSLLIELEKLDLNATPKSKGMLIMKMH